MWHPLAIFALFGVLFSIYMHYYDTMDPVTLADPPKCDEGELSMELAKYNKDLKTIDSLFQGGECMFGTNYSASRALFRAYAERAGFEHSTLPVMDDLVTDVAILRGDPHKFLVSVSGVHGVEGYAGSGSQIAALRYFADRKSHRRQLYEARGSHEKEGAADGGEGTKLPPTIVFVHALNPFGFANNRRVNEDNIDINRNFLTDEQFAVAMARDPNFASYVDIDFMINPQTMPTTSILINDIWGFSKTVYAALKFGLGSVKRALVSGNYFSPKGLGFGGFKRSKSVENLIHLADQIGLPSASKLVLIDVHTGLGISGQDTLVLFSGEEEGTLDFIESVFPAEYAGGSQKPTGGIKEFSQGSPTGAKPSAMAGYELTIGTMDDFCRYFGAPHLSGRNSLCITQEFGTVGMVHVGKSLMDENYAWHWGSAAEKVRYGRRLKASFFIDTVTWKRQVVHRGLKVILQGFDALLV